MSLTSGILNDLPENRCEDDMVTYVQYPVAKYLTEIDSIASRYHASWWEIHTRPDLYGRMSADDRMDFDSIRTVYWHELFERDFNDPECRTPENDHEPGQVPGSLILA
jgi:hypothetical protein